MASALVNSPDIQDLLDKVSGLDQPNGDSRAKQIVRRIVGNLFATIDEFNVSDDEFWAALNFLVDAAPEFSLIAPGLGFDHFLDVRADAAAAKAGLSGGTPRTIEGPLYVAGAPRAKGVARLDDGTETGEVLLMNGQVLDLNGRPIAGALVEVWHANTRGNYSYFDRSQSAFNLRRTIETDAEGRYGFRTIMPRGYSVPPQGSTDRLLQQLGRHGSRPAHIHFFVSADGFRHLTTQINMADDPLVHDDFAYATRDGLIPDLIRHDSPEDIQGEGLDSPYAEIRFDFVLSKAQTPEEAARSMRRRAEG